MKVLFLDIDGVLNSEKFFLNRGQPSFPFSFDRAQDIDPIPCALVNEFCDDNDVKIVLSSTWRLDHNEQQIMSVFRRRGLFTEVIGRTPVLHGRKRGEEIETFIKNHPSLNIERFVILDDDSDFLDGQPLVQTNWEEGLSAQHIEAAKVIING